MKIIFLAFAGGERFEALIPRFRSQCSLLCPEAEVMIFTRSDLPQDYFNDFHFVDCLKDKGYGYWSWKPWLVKHVMDKVSSDSIIFYIDIGSELNYHGKKRFNDYLNIVKNHGALFFELEWTNRQYCKQQLLQLFPDNMSDLPQIMATSFGLLNNERARNLIDDWLKWASREEGAFLKDPHAHDSQDPMFKAHRHDQSILSLLVRQRGFDVIRDETWYPRFWKAMRYPILAVRNLHPEPSLDRLWKKFRIGRWFVRIP